MDTIMCTCDTGKGDTWEYRSHWPAKLTEMWIQAQWKILSQKKRKMFEKIPVLIPGLCRCSLPHALEKKERPKSEQEEFQNNLQVEHENANIGISRDPTIGSKWWNESKHLYKNLLKKNMSYHSHYETPMCCHIMDRFPK